MRNTISKLTGRVGDVVAVAVIGVSLVLCVSLPVVGLTLVAFGDETTG